MLRLVVLSVLFLALIGGNRALAQAEGESGGPAAEAPAAENDAPQAEDNWVVTCDQSQEGAEKRCTLLQNLAVRSGEAQQRLLTVLVQRQPGGEDMMLLLSLPHGLFLPAGAQIRIDEGEPSKIVIQTSDASGSYAATALTPELLDALRRGRVLNVTMMSANQRGITVPVTLIGFNRGYAELMQELQ